jgi:hypothetical protein
MKRLVFAFVAAVMLAGSVAVFAGSPAVMAGDQDFTLINKTGLTIDELYVSPTSVNDWEEDVLGVDTLANGAKIDIKFSRKESVCSWDMKIVDEDGDEVVWTKLDLCKAEEITLNYANGKPTAIIK